MEMSWGCEGCCCCCGCPASRLRVAASAIRWKHKKRELRLVGTMIAAPDHHIKGGGPILSSNCRTRCGGYLHDVRNALKMRRRSWRIQGKRTNEKEEEEMVVKEEVKPGVNQSVVVSHAAHHVQPKLQEELP